MTTYKSIRMGISSRDESALCPIPPGRPNFKASTRFGPIIMPNTSTVNAAITAPRTVLHRRTIERMVPRIRSR